MLHEAHHRWARLLFRAHHHQQNMRSCTIWRQMLLQSVFNHHNLLP
jgi:hypothetical protein